MQVFMHAHTSDMAPALAWGRMHTSPTAHTHTSDMAPAIALRTLKPPTENVTTQQPMPFLRAYLQSVAQVRIKVSVSCTQPLN